MLNVRKICLISFLSLFNYIYFSKNFIILLEFFELLNYFILSIIRYQAETPRLMHLGSLWVNDQYHDFEPCLLPALVLHASLWYDLYHA